MDRISVRWMILSGLVALTVGCSPPGNRFFIDWKKDPFAVHVVLDNDYNKVTIRFRNISNKVVYICDSLTPSARFRFPSGPTAFWIEDSSGIVLTKSVSKDGWWYGETESAWNGPAESDAVALQPGNSIEGNFNLKDCVPWEIVNASDRSVPLGPWVADKRFKIKVHIYRFRDDPHEVSEFESRWFYGKDFGIAKRDKN